MIRLRILNYEADSLHGTKLLGKFVGIWLRARIPDQQQAENAQDKQKSLHDNLLMRSYLLLRKHAGSAFPPAELSDFGSLLIFYITAKKQKSTACLP